MLKREGAKGAKKKTKQFFIFGSVRDLRRFAVQRIFRPHLRGESAANEHVGEVDSENREC